MGRPPACGRTTLIKAAFNGSRRRSEHPGVPVTARELAREAVAVRRAGAGAVHLHPRAVTREDSLAWQDVGPAVAAVRAHAPGLPVGVTTGAWAAPDPDERVRLVAGWAAAGVTDRPDFASVNWHEDGADDVAHRSSRPHGRSLRRCNRSGRAAVRTRSGDRGGSCAVDRGAPGQ